MSFTVTENAKFNSTSQTPKSTPKGDLVTKFMVKELPRLSMDMDIYEAAKLLIKWETNGLPVMDENKKLVGFLSEKDCLKYSFDSKYNALPPAKVKDFMSYSVQTLSANTDIFQAIDLFINNNYHCYPIMDGDNYLGLLYRSNALKAVSQMTDDIF